MPAKPATKFIRNVNVTGDVWNPLVGSVAAGDVVEAEAAIADELAEQIGNWIIVDNPTATPSKES